jgi:hypothetical protein
MRGRFAQVREALKRMKPGRDEEVRRRAFEVLADLPVDLGGRQADQLVRIVQCCDRHALVVSPHGALIIENFRFLTRRWNAITAIITVPFSASVADRAWQEVFEILQCVDCIEQAIKRMCLELTNLQEVVGPEERAPS